MNTHQINCMLKVTRKYLIEWEQLTYHASMFSTLTIRPLKQGYEVFFNLTAEQPTTLYFNNLIEFKSYIRQIKKDYIVD